MRKTIISVLLALSVTTITAGAKETPTAGVTKELAKITAEKLEENGNADKPVKQSNAEIGVEKVKVDKVKAKKNNKAKKGNKTRIKYTKKEIKNICRTVNEELAKCVYSEAGNQSEYGKRLVCDTILNRVDSDSFPNSIHGVISQPYQYSVYWNGAMSKACPDEETYIVCYEELEKRTNNEVLYFRTSHYFNFGTPVLKEGDHYFSK